MVTCTVAAGGCRSLIDCTGMGGAYLCITLARQTRHLITLSPIPSHVSCCIIAWPCPLEILGFFMNLTLLLFPILLQVALPFPRLTHSGSVRPVRPAYFLLPLTSILRLDVLFFNPKFPLLFLFYFQFFAFAFFFVTYFGTLA